ncbi:semaphorin-2A-like isoform X2 [Ornithodoros turicata]|uniref:semaphorin-2A-like isoform X2 n=1 Tax=Ornithodoros turicata TaxID=34597 RepID=UPI0031399DD1
MGGMESERALDESEPHHGGAAHEDESEETTRILTAAALFGFVIVAGGAAILFLRRRPDEPPTRSTEFPVPIPSSTMSVSPTEPSTVQPTNVTTVSPGTGNASTPGPPAIPEFNTFTCDPAYYYTYYMDRRRGFLIIGAKDTLYKLPLNNINDTVCGGLTKSADGPSRSNCLGQLQQEKVCHNYIKFILPLKEGSTLLVCGSNARSPAHFEVYADAFTVVPDLLTTLPHQAEGICSSEYFCQDLGLWVGTDLFTATATEGNANKQTILRTRLIRNDTSSTSYQTDLDVISTHGAELFMKEAEFRGMFAIGEHVYIFFHEVPLETGSKSSLVRKVYSRIARLCKNDRGGGQANSWTSFLKVRLTCVLAEAHVKYFDFLGIYNIPGEDIIYGIFSNRFTGEFAICSFQLSNITDAFNGTFLKPPDPTIYPDGKWIDVDEADVPQPRPGQCVSDSRTLPVDVVSFIDDHPLLATVIQGDASYVSGQMVAIAVVKVKVGGTSYSVIYTGDRDGIIYQIVEKNPQTNNVSELVDTFPAFIKEPIWKIDISKEHNSLYVFSEHVVMQYSLYACSDRYRECSKCVRNPFCGWHAALSVCRPYIDKLAPLRLVLQKALTRHSLSDLEPPVMLLYPGTTYRTLSQEPVVLEASQS